MLGLFTGTVPMMASLMVMQGISLGMWKSFLERAIPNFQAPGRLKSNLESMLMQQQQHPGLPSYGTGTGTGGGGSGTSLDSLLNSLGGSGNGPGGGVSSLISQLLQQQASAGGMASGNGNGNNVQLQQQLLNQLAGLTGSGGGNSASVPLEQTPANQVPSSPLLSSDDPGGGEMDQNEYFEPSSTSPFTPTPGTSSTSSSSMATNTPNSLVETLHILSKLDPSVIQLMSQLMTKTTTPKTPLSSLSLKAHEEQFLHHHHDHNPGHFPPAHAHHHHQLYSSSPEFNDGQDVVEDGVGVSTPAEAEATLMYDPNTGQYFDQNGQEVQDPSLGGGGDVGGQATSSYSPLAHGLQYQVPEEMRYAHEQAEGAGEEVEGVPQQYMTAEGEDPGSDAHIKYIEVSSNDPHFSTNHAASHQPPPETQQSEPDLHGNAPNHASMDPNYQYVQDDQGNSHETPQNEQQAIHYVQDAEESVQDSPEDHHASNVVTSKTPQQRRRRPQIIIGAPLITTGGGRKVKVKHRRRPSKHRSKSLRSARVRSHRLRSYKYYRDQSGAASSQVKKKTIFGMPHLHRRSLETLPMNGTIDQVLATNQTTPSASNITSTTPTSSRKRRSLDRSWLSRDSEEEDEDNDDQEDGDQGYSMFSWRKLRFNLNRSKSRKKKKTPTTPLPLRKQSRKTSASSYRSPRLNHPGFGGRYRFVTPSYPHLPTSYFATRSSNGHHRPPQPLRRSRLSWSESQAKMVKIYPPPPPSTSTTPTLSTTTPLSPVMSNVQVSSQKIQLTSKNNCSKSSSSDSKTIRLWSQKEGFTNGQSDDNKCPEQPKTTPLPPTIDPPAVVGVTPFNFSQDGQTIQVSLGSGGGGSAGTAVTRRKVPKPRRKLKKPGNSTSTNSSSTTSTTPISVSIAPPTLVTTPTSAPSPVNDKLPLLPPVDPTSLSQLVGMLAQFTSTTTTTTTTPLPPPPTSDRKRGRGSGIPGMSTAQLMKNFQEMLKQYAAPSTTTTTTTTPSPEVIPKKILLIPSSNHPNRNHRKAHHDHEAEAEEHERPNSGETFTSPEENSSQESSSSGESSRERGAFPYGKFPKDFLQHVLKVINASRIDSFQYDPRQGRKAIQGKRKHASNEQTSGEEEEVNGNASQEEEERVVDNEFGGRTRGEGEEDEEVDEGNDKDEEEDNKSGNGVRDEYDQNRVDGIMPVRHSFKRVCYYLLDGGRDGRLSVDKLELHICSHLIVGYAHISPSGTVVVARPLEDTEK